VGVFGLCKKDPVVTALREVFKANVLRVPEGRMQPLSAIAARDGQHQFMGPLSDLLDGSAPGVTAKLVKPSQMGNLVGKKTREVDADVGLDILEGFLGGFGLPVAAGVKAKFSGAQKVSFMFSDVVRRWVPLGQLGKALEGRKLADNPATRILLGDDPWELRVVDSVIGSSDFTISVDRKSAGAFKLDVPAIQKLVGDAKVGLSVESTSELDITFKGRERLSFAFSVMWIWLAADGRIAVVHPSAQDINAAEAGIEEELGPRRVLLVPEPAMISWDR
jgi:hypothetical protein